LRGFRRAAYLSPYEPGDFRYVGTRTNAPRPIQKVTEQDIHEFYKQFYGAGAAEAALRRQASIPGRRSPPSSANWLGSLERARAAYQRAPPASTAHRRFTSKPSPDLPTSQRRVHRQRQSAAARRRSRLCLPAGRQCHLRRRLFDSRLATRIRQQDGLSYTVGSGIRAVPGTPSVPLRVLCHMPPQNLPSGTRRPGRNRPRTQGRLYGHRILPRPNPALSNPSCASDPATGPSRASRPASLLEPRFSLGRAHRATRCSLRRR